MNEDRGFTSQQLHRVAVWYANTHFALLKTAAIGFTALFAIVLVTMNYRAVLQFRDPPDAATAIAAPTTPTAGDRSTVTDATEPAQPTTSTVFAPLAPATDCRNIACKMTRDSGVFGIPLPEDASGTATALEVTTVSDESTIEELSRFYDAWLRTHGMNFMPQLSISDPKRAEAKGLGHVVRLNYCTWSEPARTASVTIGYKDPTARTGTRIDLKVVLKGVTCRSA